MIRALILACMLLSDFAVVPAFAQAPVQEPELRNPTIVVTGSRQKQAEAFVDQVRPGGWASAKRGVPRWNDELCISVIGPTPKQGQFIVDRISERAIKLGLEAGGPGCDTNLLVIVTNDPETLMPVIAEKYRALFGFAGNANVDTSGSETSLSAFLASKLPVRWRQVIETVGADGMPLEGDPTTNAFDNSRDKDPRWKNAFSNLPITRTESTRLRSTVRRQLNRVVVVVDTRQTAGIGLGPIADYLAFVTLADVSPDADMASFPSILNLFNPQAERLSEMSDWDEAFLSGLYTAKLNSASGTMQYREIAGRVAEYGAGED